MYLQLQWWWREIYLSVWSAGPPDEPGIITKGAGINTHLNTIEFGVEQHKGIWPGEATEHLNPKIPNSYSTVVNRYPSLHWKQHFHQHYCPGGLRTSNLKDLFQSVWSISRASSWSDIFDFPFLWKAQLTGPCKWALSHRDTSLSVPRCSHTNHFIVLLLFEEMPIDLELLS